MKNKSLKLGLTYFFRQHIYSKDSSGNLLRLVKPESERERTENVIEDILRWEDDGGKIIEISYAMPDRQFVQPVLINRGMHAASLQWNGQFVIEPFQAGTRIDLIKRKAPNNRPSM